MELTFSGQPLPLHRFEGSPLASRSSDSRKSSFECAYAYSEVIAFVDSRHFSSSGREITIDEVHCKGSRPGA